MKVKPTRKKGKVVVELGPRDQAILGKAPAGAAFRLKQILVPIDFSECSRKALLYALALARQFGGAIRLVHVIEAAYLMGDFGAVDYAALEADLRTEAEKQLRRLAEAEIGTSVPCAMTIRSGRPATEIAEAAREFEADLVVIATHGRTGLKHVLLGSVAENVVRHAPCPVLTVRESEREFVES
jgi:nucleotide-binding universal stress UspA family protein